MSEFRVLSNRLVAKDTYELRLSGDTSAMQTPGQFLALALPGFFLRRPMSVCDWDDQGLRLFYKVVGKGTQALMHKTDGTLDALIGLGNGFSLADANDKTPVLVGGGVGVPPLFAVAKALVSARDAQSGDDSSQRTTRRKADVPLKLQETAAPIVLLGFNTREEIFLADEFSALGCDVRLFTMDGSAGNKGTVLAGWDALCSQRRPENYFVYTCGPMPMFRALYSAMQEKGIDGAFSLEERMGCAVGICMGCTVETVNGPRRVCKEGPVFKKEELPWA